MKIRFAILIGLILAGGAGYAYFGKADDFYPAGKNEYIHKMKRSALPAGKSKKGLTGHLASDVAYAIVVMPKSYVPLLKQFSRSKMARNLKILPAQIGWNDGQPVVIPQQAILKTAGSRTPSVEKVLSPADTGDITGPEDRTIVLRKAALLLMLQGSLSGKLNYQPNRVSASASSSLHR